MRWKRTVIALAVLGVAACGDDRGDSSAGAPVVPAESDATADNRPPSIERISLTPPRPRPGQAIRAKAAVADADGDSIRLEHDWYVDRVLVREGSSDTLDTELSRGSEVHVVVRASDGRDETRLQSGSVIVQNSAPIVTAIRHRPEEPTAAETLLVEAVVEDLEGDAYDLEFEWLVDGQALSDVRGPTLDPGRAKRGESVQVRVRALDGDPGPYFESEPIVFANASPEIKSKPPLRLDNGAIYRYQIQAEDPDGDRPIRYELVEGPEGMTVDFVDGVLEWQVPQEAEGKFPIEILARDAYGGRGRQKYDLELQWQTVPASSDESEDSEGADADDD